MTKEFIQGNVAAARSALENSLKFYAGYPITPSTECMEYLASKMSPKYFINAFSEVETINLLYGAGACGVRNMTATSGCGFSLMREGFSYMIGANIPSVIYIVSRFGPGLGGLTPSNQDITLFWGVGHGESKTVIFTPSTVQEIADCTMWAFNIADTLRVPVFVIVDAILGQMYELCEIKKSTFTISKNDWAIGYDKNNVITSRRSVVGSYQSLDDEQTKQIDHVINREKNMLSVCQSLTDYSYKWKENEEGIYIVGIGTTGRVVQEVADKKGYGSIVPILLSPMPKIPNVENLYVVEIGGTALYDIMRYKYPDAVIHSIVFKNSIPTEDELMRKLL